MSVNVTWNGTVYPIPVQGDPNWAPPLTRYLVAIATGQLTLTGGAFTLLADVNFGPNYGLLSKYFTSITANPATAGVLRLAKTDALEWRNNANSGNLALTIDGTDQINFNGVPLANPAVLTQNHIYVGNASNQPGNVAMSGDATIVSAGTLTIAAGAIVDSKVNAAAAIALSKLATVTGYDWITSTSGGVLQGTAVTPSSAVATDSNGLPTASATTSTQLGYLSNVTSDVQAQINVASGASNPSGAIIMYGGSAAPSGWLLCDGTSYLRATYPALFTAIGTTFGSADGTHFNVPSMANYFPIGAGSSAALGTNAGSTTVNITDPTHNHTQNAHQHIGTSGQNGATIFVPTTSGASDWPYGSTAVNSTNTVVGGTNDGATSLNYANTSTTTATNIAASTGITATALPPCLGLTFIIKT